MNRETLTRALTAGVACLVGGVLVGVVGVWRHAPLWLLTVVSFVLGAAIMLSIDHERR